MNDHDPPRLLDLEASADPALRAALRMASTSTPSVAQIEALALKLGAATATGAGAAGAAKQAGGLASQLGLAKLAVVLMVGAAAAWLGLSYWRSSHEPPPTRLPTPAENELSVPLAQPSAPSPRALPAARLDVRSPQLDADPATERLADEAKAPSTEAPSATSHRPGTRPSHAGRAANRAAAPDRRAPQAPQDTAQPQASVNEGSKPIGSSPRASELSLLGQAQGLLARDPDGALDVIEEHARLYPKGDFAEEREALSIDALRRLGRNAEMRGRARAFLDRYPVSPHRDRIEKWLR